MNTLDLELAVMYCFDFKRNIIIPNITATFGFLKFETDMLVLTKNGYAHGLELKISKSDLKNDLKKKQWISVTNNKEKAINLFFDKYKYFSYVVTNELVECALNQIPDFCGLYTPIVYHFSNGDRVTLKEIRKPRTLNKYKFTEKEIRKTLELGCMRIYNLKQKINTSQRIG